MSSKRLLSEETNMGKYRNSLPQLDGGFFMTDGGIETTLIFLEGQELPYFAAFGLLRTAEGQAVLRKYFRTYAKLAAKFRAGLVPETATWRANADWLEDSTTTPMHWRTPTGVRFR